jgi:hypothetical protein
MKHCLFIFFILLSASGMAQSTHDFMVTGGLDAIKTDNIKLFDKAQLGFDANYFIDRRFAVGIGAELWTTRQKNSFVMGARWYANDNIFVRFRGLIGANDAALGAGYSKAIKDNWRLEAMGDYYFNGSAFGIRGGIAYVIRRK